MANPAWSTDGITWNTLPGAYRYGGKPASFRRTSIDLETDSGARFVYNLSGRVYMELIFTISDDELPFYEELDETVDGDSTPFFFSLAGNGSDAIFVRKEKDFDPQELEQPNGASGNAMYNYVLQITEEVE